MCIRDSDVGDGLRFAGIFQVEIKLEIAARLNVFRIDQIAVDDNARQGVFLFLLRRRFGDRDVYKRQALTSGFISIALSATTSAL